MPSSLFDRAAAVLRANDRGGYTVPAPHLYPHQWAWDSAFSAIGWAALDLGRAVAELETLLDGQWPDGRVPHIRFRVETRDYWPGPDFWGTRDRSAITQPPVWATAARRLLDAGAERAALARLLPAIDRSHRFFHERRDPLGWGLVAIVHPWESGLDNSPAWDAPMEAIDPALAPPFSRVDQGKVDDAAQRPSDRDYRRYAVLVKAIAADGFGPGPLAVYDPLMTSLLLRGEEDLAALGDALEVPTEAAARARRLRAGLVDHLWDDRLGRFRFYDVAARRPHAPEVIAAYAPLVLPAPVGDAARMMAALRARYLTAWPLPSVPPGDPCYDPRRYWRGPAWVNINWLFAPAFGDELRERTLALIEREGFREYYHPESGEGLGARDFSWTAALTLDWLARR